jgi:dGTPase
VRHGASLVVPEPTAQEIAVLKGIAAHYVMRAEDRLASMERQRVVVSELFEALLRRAPDGLDPMFRRDHDEATGDPARMRVVVDQVASLTDASAVAWHRHLCP